MEYAQKNLQGLISTDFSKFDGTISHWLRTEVEQRCYLEAFNGDAKLRNLLIAETKAKARTRFGVTYEPKSSRLSGSPLTTDGNTLINAFVAYAAWRLAYPKSTHEHSFNKIGPKAGDDSIESVNIRQTLLTVCEALGLKVKIDVIRPHQPVPYLGRYWVDPWTTEYSMQDLARTLPKLSVSANRQHDKFVSLQNKICGYYITDSKTPLLGDICRCVAARYGFKLSELEIHKMIGADKDLLHKLQMGPYPQPPEGQADALKVAATSLQTTVADVLRAIERLHAGELTTFFNNQVEDTKSFNYLENGVLMLAAGKEGKPNNSRLIHDNNAERKRTTNTQGAKRNLQPQRQWRPKQA